MSEAELAVRISDIDTSLAVIKLQIEDLEKRIEKNSAIADSFHALSSDVRLLMEQLKSQNEKYETRFERFEDRQKSQGERIGELEKVAILIQGLPRHIDDSIAATNRTISELKVDIAAIKDKPAKRMDGMVTQVIGSLITALVTFLAIKIGLK